MRMGPTEPMSACHDAGVRRGLHRVVRRARERRERKSRATSVGMTGLFCFFGVKLSLTDQGRDAWDRTNQKTGRSACAAKEKRVCGAES
jgi:hypothetical protein